MPSRRRAGVKPAMDSEENQTLQRDAEQETALEKSIKLRPKRGGGIRGKGDDLGGEDASAANSVIGISQGSTTQKAELSKKRRGLVSVNEKDAALKRVLSTGVMKDKVAGLVDQLVEAHAILRELRQRSDDSEELSPQLLKLTSNLVSTEILNSASPRIRWLAAQCFADILFLHAPDAPFEDATLKHVFRVLVDSLRGLNQDESTEASNAARYVLGRMAICKLGCILVDLPETLPGDGGIKTSELAAAMFETVFNSIAPSHSVTVEHDSVELLVGYLEEGNEESYPFAVLDSVLQRLLPEHRKESHRAYDVARAVIARCSEKLRNPLTTLINGLLLGEFDRVELMHDVEKSSIKDCVHMVVVELFRIDPNLLLHVLPSVENILEVDDQDSRAKAVKLLVDIFGEVRTDSAILEHERLLLSVMRRFLDKAVGIRHSVLQFAGKCLTRTDSPKQLVQMLLSRGVSGTEGRMTLLETALHDAERTIRAEAVEICASVLVNNWHDPVSSPADPDQMAALAKTLAGRLHDVSTDIALRAMEGLSWAYSKHLTALSWVPNMILGDESKRDVPSDYRRFDEARIGLIDQVMLGTKEDLRSQKLILMFANLSSPRAKANFFRCVFKLRTQVRKEISAVLEMRRAKKKVDESATDDLRFLDIDVELWKLLWNVTDNRIFERWAAIVNPLSARQDMIEAKRDLIERIGAALKSQQIENDKITKCKGLVKRLCRWAGLWTLCSDELISAPFLKEATTSASELVYRFIEAFPGAFQRADFLDNLLEDHPDLTLLSCVACNLNFDSFPSVGTALRDRLAVVARGIEDDNAFVIKKSRNKVDDDPKLRKLAVKAVIKLSNEIAEDAQSVVDLLCARKNKWSAGDLYVCLTVARLVPNYPIEHALVQYCVEKVKKPYSSTPSQQEITLKTVAIKLIVEFLSRSLSNGDDTAQCRSLLLMLRSFVSDLGDPWTGQAKRSKESRFRMWPPSDEEAHIRLRLTSAVGLMKLEVAFPKAAALSEGEGELVQLKRQARRFVERSRLAFDPSQPNREAFMRKFVSLELDHGLNMHRNGALLAIIAASHEGSNHSNRAAVDLRQLVKFLAQKSQASKLNGDDKAMLVAPELILPNLIYILAHHPLFPTEDSDFAPFLKAHQRALTGPILTLLDAITGAHGKAQSRVDASVSFMLAALAAVRTRKDVLDDHHGIYCICDLARLVIQEHIKYSPAGLETFKARVPLPKVFIELSPVISGSEPRTPTNAAVHTTYAPSPISYLPVGFELEMASARKRSRPKPSLGASSKRKIARLSGSKTESPSGRPTLRKQPRRSARMSKSFLEEELSSSDDEMSSSSLMPSGDEE